MTSPWITWKLPDEERGKRVFVTRWRGREFPRNFNSDRHLASRILSTFSLFFLRISKRTHLTLPVHLKCTEHSRIALSSLIIALESGGGLLPSIHRCLLHSLIASCWLVIDSQQSATARLSPTSERSSYETSNRVVHSFASCTDYIPRKRNNPEELMRPKAGFEKWERINWWRTNYLSTLSSE